MPAPPHRPFLPLGRRCETCDDGFFGDPLGLSGDPQPCRRCQCSGNVDPNAVGNCDPLSGHCLRCLFNTTGARCERCQEGFYGSALASRPADKCACEFPSWPFPGSCPERDRVCSSLRAPSASGSDFPPASVVSAQLPLHRERRRLSPRPRRLSPVTFPPPLGRSQAVPPGCAVSFPPCCLVNTRPGAPSSRSEGQGAHHPWKAPERCWELLSICPELAPGPFLHVALASSPLASWFVGPRRVDPGVCL